MNTIFGTAFDDTLEGTAGADSISGEGGNDWVIGGGGDDDLSTWGGDDTLEGGDGDDTIQAGDGNNSVEGGAGDDQVSSGMGEDYIDVGDGDDYINVRGGQNTLRGGDGNDTLYISELGGASAGDDVDCGAGDDKAYIMAGSFDTIHGGAGNDSLSGGGNEDSLYGDDGEDTLRGFGGDDYLSGGLGQDILRGDAGADELAGGDGNDTLIGGAGADTLLGGAGDDVLYVSSNDDIDGGAGSDWLRFSGFSGLDLDLAAGTLSGGDVENVSFSNVENVQGTEGDDKICGDEGDNYLLGYYGHDTLEGRAGDDTLATGGQSAVMSGGDGADLFIISDNAAHAVITDFDGAAGDVLDFSHIATGLNALTLVQNGADVDIYGPNGYRRLTLQGYDKDGLDASMFQFADGDGSLFTTTPSEAVTQSGEVTVDALLNGYAYMSQDELTYGFPGSQSIFLDGDYNGGIDTSAANTGFKPLLGIYQDVARTVAETVMGYTNLTLTETEDAGSSAPDIRIGMTDMHGAYAWTQVITHWNNNSQSDVWFGQVFQHVPSTNGADVAAVYHELGHALGLKHPFEGDTVLDAGVDGNDYTVMSYMLSARHPEALVTDLNPTGFMQYDIRALQYLYGVDTETSGGDDSYVFDLSGRYFEALWDAGGIDTLEITGTGAAVSIDLTPGSWSNIGTTITYSAYDADTQQESFWYESQTLFIMDDTIIENAVGSSGDDTLKGNDADNILRGMDGNDVLKGMAGDDEVHGGAGNDTIWAGAGDAGDDSLYGDAGADVIGAGAGNDLAAGGAGSDTLYGGAGNDTLAAGDWSNGAAAMADGSHNTVWAGAGDDVVYGDSGNDALGGGLGDDRVVGGDGNDVLYGGPGDGVDTLMGGLGRDTLFGGAGDDSLSGGQGHDLIFNGTGADFVDGGSGNDTLWGGPGDDTLTGGTGADIFRFGSANGTDTVTDFNADEDTLNIHVAGFADMDALRMAAVEDDTGVTISFGDTVILLEGIGLDDLTADAVVL